MSEISPTPERHQPLPDEIIVINGIAGVRGSKGKFYPITTDMGVEIKGDVNDPWEKPRLEPMIPNFVSENSEHQEPTTPDNWDTISALMRIKNHGDEDTV